MPIIGQEITAAIASYGYLAVLLFVAVESTGIPVPGETMLLTAAIYAGTTHRLHIAPILGDNLGFWVGREVGYKVVRRYGRSIRLDERRRKLGQYLFRLHGGKVVFFGRFVAVPRAWAAFLAGVNRMPWGRFLIDNAAGALCWTTLYAMAWARTSWASGCTGSPARRARRTS